jgi:hydrogenase maturation protease
MKRILIAGVGNIFCGDDAFGVEVARQLMAQELPPEVSVQDFGIRGYDLAYALAGDYAAAVLVDATPRGEPSGTVSLIEPDTANLEPMQSGTVDGHSMDPVCVLQMAHAFGGSPGKLYLVGCEPGVLDSPEGRFALSPSVQEAVPRAIEMIRELIRHLLTQDLTTESSAVRA